MPTQHLLNRLIKELPNSHAAIRKEFAQLICQQNIDLTELLPLATEDPKVSSRFFWLLSDVAEIAPEKLEAFLPQLFAIRHKTTYQNVHHSFARYWNLYALPEQMEAEAMELLFAWFSDSGSSVSLKVHAMYALQKLAAKHPDIQPELVAAIGEQLGKSTAAFDRAARKVLTAFAQ